jgi:glycerol-3-phosphate dehydrogenase (NAD(P)+)
VDDVGRIAVVGAGSWGTAFAQIAADAGNDVVIWGRDDEIVDAITAEHVNPVFHPGARLPDSVWASTNIGTVLRGAEIVALAIPSQVLRSRLMEWREHFGPSVVLSLIKGLELDTSLRMTEVVRDVTGLPSEQVGVLSGPNLAREIIERQPAAAVVAFGDPRVAADVQTACATAYFRPYTNTDVVGVELGGSVKNVIALAVGMAAGMGFGDNAKASLITRGLAETVRLGVSLGSDPLTFSGLAGVGDLVATCMSPLSRNRTFGELLGKGLSVAEAVAATQQTAEGVASSKSILDLARRYGVDMPITEAVESVVHEGASPRDMVGAMMARGTKSETVR